MAETSEPFLSYKPDTEQVKLILKDLPLSRAKFILKFCDRAPDMIANRTLDGDKLFATAIDLGILKEVVKVLGLAPEYRHFWKENTRVHPGQTREK